MTLDDALRILAGIHTRDDDVTGFCVLIGAVPSPFDFGADKYSEAWQVVREHLRLPADAPDR